jgi:hypothetical protein
MKIITVRSWKDFNNEISPKHYRKWIFRGHTDYSWKLESSLYRAFREALAIHELHGQEKENLDRNAHERVMIDKFKRNAHLFLSHLPNDDDDLSWLALMQHYGAPTRLLDFSFSPYIALYFALELGTEDASFFCINHHALKIDDEDQFGSDCKNIYSRVMYDDKTEKVCLFSFEPIFSNQRLLSQQGILVAPNTLYINHEDILSEYQIEDNDFVKYKIPKKLRYSGLKMLNQMNINAANIYPGLEGFCKSMKNQPVFGLKWQKRVGD